MPASSLLDIDQTRLAAHLYNFTTSHSQKFRILKESDLLYSYRNAFSVYFTSKVAAAHFYSIQHLLLETWQKTKGKKNTKVQALAQFDLYIDTL